MVRPVKSATAQEWQRVCKVGELEIDRGATALVHGQAIALFRLQIDGVDHVYALGNHDPFAKASVIAKGIVGVRGITPFVGSPAHRHAFDLRNGLCLEDPHFSVPAYAVRIDLDGVVAVGPRIS